MNNEHKKIIIIFLIATCLRMLLFVAVGSWQDKVLNERILISDSIGYNRIAVNLLENNGFSRSVSQPYVTDIFRTPIYPFFLASLYTIFGYKPFIAILFQIIVGSLICVLTYKIGRIFFNEKIAFLAGLIVAFEYSNILYSNLLLTETLFTYLFIVHIYFLGKFLISNNSKGLFYSAIFLGLSTLCRPISIYFVIFLIWIFYLHFRKNFRKGFLTYSTLTLVFILTITPWMIRNYMVSGKFLVSSIQEKVLHWHLPHIMKPPRTIKSSPILKEVHPLQEEKVKYQSRNYSIPRDKARQMLSKKKIVNSLLSDTKRYITGIVRFFAILSSSAYPQLLGLPIYKMNREDWNKGPWEMVKIAIREKSRLEWFSICFSISIMFFIYSTMCIGIYAALKGNRYMEIVLFISIIVYFAIATGPVGSLGINYRVPIMPYMILLSSYGMIQLQSRFREYEYRIRRETDKFPS